VVDTDRLYSLDNIWVKSLGGNVVQFGMSDPFQALASKVNTCSLLPTGTILQAEQPFGSIEADKLSVDLISPVSGTIVGMNGALTALPGPINLDPYNSGWMVNVQMSNPSQMNALVSPQYYVYLMAPTWTGPVPPMH
jgi:glycine cleavage system H protein